MSAGTARNERVREGVTDALHATRKPIPLYHVVLLDDDDHTVEYAMDMLRRVFACSREDAAKLANEVDSTGRATVETTTRERAEFKQEQVHAFGPDKRLARCQGSMTCILEPADGGA